jgi:hypothetical protein
VTATIDRVQPQTEDGKRKSLRTLDAIVPQKAGRCRLAMSSFIQRLRFMKEYRDLTISGSRDVLLATVAEIEKNLNEGWMRDRKVEDEGLERAFLTKDELRFCFRCAPTSSRKGALLVLMSHPENPEDSLWLSNIVPDEFGQFTHDEFNYILEEFLHRFARSAAAKAGATIEASTGIIGLEDWFSKETADKLRRFLSETGGSTSHPTDYGLWMDFVAAARREEASVHVDLLRRWLEEDAGCDEYRASKLANEYQVIKEYVEFVGA